MRVRGFAFFVALTSFCYGAKPCVPLLEWEQRRFDFEKQIRESATPTSLTGVLADLWADNGHPDWGVFVRFQHLMESGQPIPPDHIGALDFFDELGRDKVPCGAGWTSSSGRWDLDWVFEPHRTNAQTDIAYGFAPFPFRLFTPKLGFVFRRGVIDQTVVLPSFIRKQKNIQKIEAALTATRASFYIHYLNMGDEGVRSLLTRLPFLGTLETFGMFAVRTNEHRIFGITDEELPEILRDLDLKNVKTLSIHGAHIQNGQVLYRLLAPPRLPALKTLDLRWCRLPQGFIPQFWEFLERRGVDRLIHHQAEEG